jgi:hypothetical protein
VVVTWEMKESANSLRVFLERGFAMYACKHTQQRNGQQSNITVGLVCVLFLCTER